MSFIKTTIFSILKMLKWILLLMIAMLVLGAVTWAIFIFSSKNVTPISQENQIYVGQWGSPTGNRVVIDPEGYGAYFSTNTNISGVPVIIEEGTISIKLMFIGPSFKITQVPTTMSNTTTMILDNTPYTKLPPDTPLPDRQFN